MVLSCEEGDTTEAGLLPDSSSPVRLMKGVEAWSQAMEHISKPRMQKEHLDGGDSRGTGK